MEQAERARIESLAQSDAELRDLWREHLELEQKLAELDQRRHPTPGELLERKRIQKLKLAGKDQIARILSQVAE